MVLFEGVSFVNEEHVILALERANPGVYVNRLDRGFEILDSEWDRSKGDEALIDTIKDTGTRVFQIPNELGAQGWSEKGKYEVHF